MKASKGFTLVELAVVIAIVAILASVAIPRLVDSTDRAELAVAKDLLTKLNSAQAMYVSQQLASPGNFASYVTSTGSATGAITLTLASIKNPTTGAAACSAPGATIICTLQKLTATYTYNGGSITLTCANTNGGTQSSKC